MPVGILTARASFHGLLTKKYKALDEQKNQFYFDDWVVGNGVIHYDDQPIIRSAKQEWFIPTISIISNHYVKKFKQRELGFRELCLIYNFTCQLCLKKKDRRDLTIEHVEARSLFGTNFTNNLSLTCRACNSKKDSAPLPYYNVEGKPLKGTVVPNNFILVDDKDMRDEWRDFIFHK
jgi:hypothetical protein